ncbi:MAG TPA: carboxymuconolactone decarboxylase family protein [Steroidobacteraceae bacterium]|nr:carboxymuconolactone decarboxylase family protein [Steroidobacteraceae bacterium]
MSRLPHAVRANFPPDEQGIFDELEGRGTRVIDIHLLLANAPNVAHPLLQVTQQLRVSRDLPANLRELAIVHTLQLNEAEYEGTRHVKTALAVGVRREQLQRLAEFETADCFSELEKAVLRLASELHVPPLTVSEPTWRALKQALSDRALTELLLAIGMYHLGSRFERAVELTIEPWYEKP